MTEYFDDLRGLCCAGGDAGVQPIARPMSCCSWWRHRNHEVDFVVRGGQHILAIEVTAGARHTRSGRALGRAPGDAAAVGGLRVLPPQTCALQVNRFSLRYDDAPLGAHLNTG